MRFTAAYAVFTSNRPASMIEILLHEVMPGGVTLFHVVPASRVT